MTRWRWVAVPLLAALLCLGCGEPSGQADPDLDFWRGRNAMAMGRYDWARFYFERDLEAHPHRAESLRQIGIAWISGYEGSVSRAIEAFRAYLEERPTDVDVSLRLAEALALKGEGDEAVRLAARHRDRLRALRVLARVAEDREPGAARRWIDMAMAETAEPGADLLRQAARIYWRDGDATGALGYLDRVFRLDSLHARDYYLRASLLQELGRAGEAEAALALFRDVARLESAPGQAPRSARERLSILRDLEARVDTNNPPFLATRCRLLLETGDAAAAENVLNDLLAHGNADLARLLSLGGTASGKRALAMARVIYREAVKRDPQNPTALAGLALTTARAGDPALAETILKEAVVDHPRHAPFFYVRALLAREGDDEPAAIASLRQAVHWAPWYTPYVIALGDALLEAGEREAFAELLDKAVNRDRDYLAYRAEHAVLLKRR